MSPPPALSSKLQWGIEPYYLLHWCPACERSHPVHIANQPNSVGALWHWDQNVDAPTFSHSLKHTITRERLINGEEKVVTDICHYYLRRGVIEFCGDCTQQVEGGLPVRSAYAGQNVPLPDIPVTPPSEA